MARSSLQPPRLLAWTRFVALTVVGSVVSIIARAQPNARGTGSVLSATSGVSRGLAVNANIWRLEYRLGFEHRFTPSLSAMGEAAFAHFLGERAGQDVNASAVTLMPLLRWSFVRTSAVRVAFDFGLGGGFFTPEFPPGGTRWNGYSLFGLSGSLALSARQWLVVDIREMHHSNGRGIVDSNPAFDGVSVNLGAAFEL